MVREPRALVRVLLGLVLAGAAVAVASVLAFGLHIPDLSTQSKLVTSESVPNLIGLALGAGGESESLHKVMDAVLAAGLLLCCWQAFSRRWPASDRVLTAAGWASVALLVTLSWVLPWYVLWALPLAALSSSRRLRAVAVVLSMYLIVAWAPASGPAVERDRLPPRKDIPWPAASALCARAAQLKAHRRGQAFLAVKSVKSRPGSHERLG